METNYTIVTYYELTGKRDANGRIQKTVKTALFIRYIGQFNEGMFIISAEYPNGKCIATSNVITII